LDSGEHLFGSGRRTPPNASASAASSSAFSAHGFASGIGAGDVSFVAQGFGHAEALDIEELVAVGRKQSLCPYYLSRNAVPGADLVLLPYNYLLDPNARAALKVGVMKRREPVFYLFFKQRNPF
jgi:hypothetical protein